MASESSMALEAITREYIGKAIIAPSIRRLTTNGGTSALLAYGRQLRDDLAWKEGILAGALQVYQQLASSREWVVSGKERPAAKAVEHLNETRSVDMNTGYIHVGFEDFLRRRALDYVCVGRVTFLSRPLQGKKTVLEYADPTDLHFSRQRPRDEAVTDEELIWTYYGMKFRHDQVFLSHAIPVGSKGFFIAPLTPIVPTMLLQYLVREHDTAALDGRKVRDIIVVANDQMKNAMITAIQTQVALWAGVNVASESGIPVVAVNQASGGTMQDMVARLSLSNLPEEFNREEFTFEYVNQIASSLGLALRHFWNNEKTTNRALEEIQEQRQQRKGPSEFVNNEQRLLNRYFRTPNVVSQMGGRVKFGFIEEIDSQSQLKRADVLKKTVEALAGVQSVFQASLSLDALLAWMQSEQVLPSELELISGSNQGTIVNPADTSQTPGETTTPGTPSPTALQEDREKSKNSLDYLDYDHITINSKGEVIARRVKVFSAAKYLDAAQVEYDAEKVKELAEAEWDDLALSFDEVVKAERQELLAEFLDAYHESNGKLLENLGDMFLYDANTVAIVTERAVKGEDLIGEDYSVLSLILDKVSSSNADDPMEDL